MAQGASARAQIRGNVDGRTIGLGWAAISVLAASADATLIQMKGGLGSAPDSVVYFWKWLLVATISGSVSLWQPRSAPPPHAVRATEDRRLLHLPRTWLHLAVGSVSVLIASLHTVGITHSMPSIAVMAFYANPLWAILFHAIFFGTGVPYLTIVTILIAVACCGVPAYLALVSQPELHAAAANATEVHVISGGSGSASGQYEWWGIILSVVASMGYAGYMTVCRSAASECPSLPMNRANAIGNGCAAAVGLVWSLACGNELFPPVATFWWLALADGLCVGISTSVVVFATMHLPATDLAMFLSSEIAFSQLLLYLFGVEVATPAKIVCGLILIGSLAAHEVMLFRGICAKMACEPATTFNADETPTEKTPLSN